MLHNLYMPTYDYICNKCNSATEAFHGINDSPEIKCSACGSNDTKRSISGGAGIHFKGTGFYVTDYKKSTNPTPSE